MDIKTIAEISEIISGHSFRGPIVEDMYGSVAILQASNIGGQSLDIGTDHLKSISTMPPRAVSILQEGDVVLVARSSALSGMKAAVFKGYHKPVIATSSVTIIRPRPLSTVLPEYLVLYVNSQLGQSALSAYARGSTIQTILKRDLEAVRIPLPSLEKQENIVQLYINIQKQERIIERQSEIKQNIINATFKSLTATYTLRFNRQ